MPCHLRNNVTPLPSYDAPSTQNCPRMIYTAPPSSETSRTKIIIEIIKRIKQPDPFDGGTWKDGVLIISADEGNSLAKTSLAEQVSPLADGGFQLSYACGRSITGLSAADIPLTRHIGSRADIPEDWKGAVAWKNGGSRRQAGLSLTCLTTQSVFTAHVWWATDKWPAGGIQHQQSVWMDGWSALVSYIYRL